jgi:hypothetical protein
MKKHARHSNETRRRMRKVHRREVIVPRCALCWMVRIEHFTCGIKLCPGKFVTLISPPGGAPVPKLR